MRVYSRQGGPLDDTATPAVVLVHGIGVSGTYMVPAATRLAAAGLRVYVPDLPGFGRSDKPRHRSTVSDLADDLSAYMDIIDVQQAALVGNSFGCQVIAEFCLRNPCRVTRIVLLGPTIDGRARTIHQQFWRLIVDSTREPLSQVLIVVADYIRFGLIRYIRTFNHSLADRIEDKAPRISVPALVMRGSRDPIVPQEWVEHLAQLLPEGQIAVVNGGPHTSNYACPDAFVQIILPFLTGAPFVTTAPGRE